MLSIYGPGDLFTLKKIIEEFRDDLYALEKYPIHLPGDCRPESFQ